MSDRRRGGGARARRDPPVTVTQVGARAVRAPSTNAATTRASTALLVAATLALFFLLTACGDAGLLGAGSARTYHDDRFGFSIEIDGRFEEWQRADATGQGAFAVTFADKDGPRAGGRYLDALMVAVVDMGADLGDAQTESMRDLLREQSALALASVGSDVRTWPAEDVVVAGLAGSVVPFTATVHGTPVTGWSYVFVRGRDLYLVIVTSAHDAWGDDRATLQRMAESFRLDDR